MKPLLIITFLLCVAKLTYAQSAPSSDIFVAEITNKNGRLQIGQLANITQRLGYDNQPYFLANQDALLYTAQLGQQTEVMRYDFTTKQPVNLTNSKVSEYSPTPMSNGKEYSVIYAGKDTQQLWAYQLTGTTKRPLIQPDFKIGYHAWVDDQQVLITVLENGSMNLQLANVNTKQYRLLHPKTGASVFAIPGTPHFSFNTHITEQHWLMQLDVESGNKHQLVQLPDDAQYYAWTPDGKVLVASQAQLWFWDSKKEDAKLTPFANIQAVCPDGASRMAVNAQQTRLALVCHGEGF